MSRNSVANNKMIIVLIILICISLIVLISNMFMYTPFNYTKVKGIGNLHWYDFKKPMHLEIEYWNGEVSENILQNQNEIKYIYDELLKSKEVEYQVNIWKRYVWFHFVKDGNKPILLIDINSEGIAKIGSDTYLKVSDNLWDFLHELQERETINLITDYKADEKHYR